MILRTTLYGASYNYIITFSRAVSLISIFMKSASADQLLIREYSQNLKEKMRGINYYGIMFAMVSGLNDVLM